MKSNTRKRKLLKFRLVVDIQFIDRISGGQRRSDSKVRLVYLGLSSCITFGYCITQLAALGWKTDWPRDPSSNSFIFSFLFHQVERRRRKKNSDGCVLVWTWKDLVRLLDWLCHHLSSRFYHTIRPAGVWSLSFSYLLNYSPTLVQVTREQKKTFTQLPPDTVSFFVCVAQFLPLLNHVPLAYLISSVPIEFLVHLIECRERERHIHSGVIKRIHNETGVRVLKGCMYCVELPSIKGECTKGLANQWHLVDVTNNDYFSIQFWPKRKVFFPHLLRHTVDDSINSSPRWQYILSN